MASSKTLESGLGDSVEGLVIVDPPRSGESNMAIDEALLQNATPAWPVVLRVYRWDRPTLSIGHFQKIEDRNEVPHLSELPWVRRKTGGGAIVHDQELTYSILFPNRANSSVKGHNEALYRAIHLCFVEQLQKLGWDARLSESCTCAATFEKIPSHFLCFSRRSPVDLIVDNAKILGSAQRRSATGLLQHGSFLLCRSQSTPELCGLLDAPGGSNPNHPKKMREKAQDVASLLEADSDNESSTSVLDDWVEFFVSTLKTGASRLLSINWQNGSIGNLPTMGKGNASPRMDD